MGIRLKTKKELEIENSGLRERLKEAESTLEAIREGSVDAFVVSKEGTTQVLTLKGTDYLYRVFVESMNEGAVTLIPDGTIFYTNQRFAEMVRKPADQLIGASFQELISGNEENNQEITVRYKVNLEKHNAIQQGLPLRFSLGVAAAETNEILSSVLKRADHEMYSNKQKRQRQQA